MSQQVTDHYQRSSITWSNRSFITTDIPGAGSLVAVRLHSPQTNNHNSEFSDTRTASSSEVTTTPQSSRITNLSLNKRCKCEHGETPETDVRLSFEFAPISLENQNLFNARISPHQSEFSHLSPAGTSSSSFSSGFSRNRRLMIDLQSSQGLDFSRLAFPVPSVDIGPYHSDSVMSEYSEKNPCGMFSWLIGKYNKRGCRQCEKVTESLPDQKRKLSKSTAKPYTKANKREIWRKIRLGIRSLHKTTSSADGSRGKSTF